MTTSTRTHFTAWLVNDTSCLDQGCMDITVLEDCITGYREGEVVGDIDLATGRGDLHREEIPVWSTDTTKPQAFYAVTAVDARDGDVKTAMDEAADLMSAAGWRIVGDWDAVDNAYIVTVARD